MEPVREHQSLHICLVASKSSGWGGVRQFSDANGGDEQCATILESLGGMRFSWVCSERVFDSQCERGLCACRPTPLCRWRGSRYGYQVGPQLPKLLALVNYQCVLPLLVSIASRDAQLNQSTNNRNQAKAAITGIFEWPRLNIHLMNI